MMNYFFVEQTILDATNASLPPNIDLPENNHNSISTSPHEEESILKSLQLGKASVPDEINNYIAKKLATPLSRPLSNLFNFSLATGKVPVHTLLSLMHVFNNQCYNLTGTFIQWSYMIIISFEYS